MQTTNDCPEEVSFKSNTFPRYRDLMSYVEKWIRELLNVGDEIKAFKTRYKLTDAVVECRHTHQGTCYIWIEFEVLPETGPLSENPLPNEALVWLQKYLGAYLWLDGTVPYQGGGGKVSYRLSIFSSKRGEDLELFDRLSPWYWAGGHWKKIRYMGDWSVREPDPQTCQ